MNIITIAFLLFIQILIFFSLGLLTFKFLHLTINSITLTLLSGFILYFSIFGLVAIPMILTSLKLSTLAYTFGTISIIIPISTIFLCQKQFFSLIYRLPKIVQKHAYMLIPLFVVTILLQLIVFTHVDSSADSSYYIGKVATDVYTNTMGHFDPYTGNPLSQLDGRRVFACFPEYNAMISYVFHIHPLYQAKLIMPQLLSLFTLVLYYQIGLQFFSGNCKKADCFVCITFLLDLYSFTIYTNSTFLLTRTYEGKSILANIIIPGLLLCFLMLWQNYNCKFTKTLLAALSISSCFFSSSSMLIVPIALTIGFSIWIYSERAFKNFVFYVICIMPNLLICILYLLNSKGVLIYSF